MNSCGSAAVVLCCVGLVCCVVLGWFVVLCWVGLLWELTDVCVIIIVRYVWLVVTTNWLVVTTNWFVQTAYPNFRQFCNILFILNDP